MKCPICGIELSPKVYELHVKECKKEEVIEEKAKGGKKWVQK